ncbi:hypothetical protein ACJJIX_18215 [Microbulbifer sp. VAAC004]|uniref:hypothetical protein n=1 Tax=unclassified Microbulbifer TaxID=2619833 RepID=UPI00403A28CD
MKLRYALLLSGVITGTVTFLAWAQPLAPQARAPIANEATAPSITSKPIVKSVTQTQTQTEVLPEKIYGMTRTAALEESGNLVEVLLQNKDILNRLKPGSHKVFIIYRGFSENYQEAQITVGLPKESFFLYDGASEAMPAGEVIRIGGGTDITSTGLEEHWKKVSFGSTLQAVVERYTLSEVGAVQFVDVYQINREIIK